LHLFVLVPKVAELNLFQPCDLGRRESGSSTKEISTFRLARLLKRDIEPRDMTRVFHPDAIGHLRNWSMGLKSHLREEGEQIERVSARAWKELIDLCLLAEIFNPDLEYKVVRAFRYKSKLEIIPNSLITYFYKRIIKGSVFRGVVMGERLFRTELLEESSYPKAFLYDLVQEQTRSFRLEDSGPMEDTGITRSQLGRSLIQLRKTLISRRKVAKSTVVWIRKG